MSMGCRMNEHSYIRNVHKELSSKVFKWKIRDSYAGGVPDAYYSGEKGCVWAEYKHIKTLPQRDTSVIKKNLFIKKLDKNKFEILSGPLHIISFIPRDMSNFESNNWTYKAKEYLIARKFMISRPIYKGKYFLRIVFGNFNTSEYHISELTNLLNNFVA